ncbi:EscU/YscU/HrcU family type III secretion system export apparatus switch protein [Thermaurantiacus sp.]
MADDTTTGEKTEAPTERRRREARAKGNVANPRELGPALSALVGALWLFVLGDNLGHAVLAATRTTLDFDRQALLTVAPLQALLRLLTPLLAPLAALAVGVLAALLLGRALVGGLVLAPRLLLPKLERLDPLKGVGRQFGRRGLVELVKAVAKGALLVGLGSVLLWRDASIFLGLSAMPLSAALATLLDRGVLLFAALAFGLVLIAGGELPVAILEWLRNLRMSRQELKDELKQTEGSPEARAAQRRARHELLKRANRRAVAEAAVVLVNPAHFAVALRYLPGLDAAPVIVARGRGPVALAIRELADELDVPILCYPEVARALFFTGRVGQMIRADLYVVVATILAFVMRLKAGAVTAPPEVCVPESARYDEEGRRQP